MKGTAIHTSGKESMKNRTLKVMRSFHAKYAKGSAKFAKNKILT